MLKQVLASRGYSTDKYQKFVRQSCEVTPVCRIGFEAGWIVAKPESMAGFGEELAADIKAWLLKSEVT